MCGLATVFFFYFLGRLCTLGKMKPSDYSHVWHSHTHSLKRSQTLYAGLYGRNLNQLRAYYYIYMHMCRCDDKRRALARFTTNNIAPESIEINIIRTLVRWSISIHRVRDTLRTYTANTMCTRGDSNGFRAHRKTLNQPPNNHPLAPRYDDMVKRRCCQSGSVHYLPRVTRFDFGWVIVERSVCRFPTCFSHLCLFWYFKQSIYSAHASCWFWITRFLS